MSEMRRSGLRDWFCRVLGWDGLLPVVILSVPAGGRLLAPDRPEALTATAVLVPIAALFVRVAIGNRQIASHRVGPAFRTCQYAVFGVAVFWLCLVDCFVIALHFAPAVPAGDAAAVVLALALYLAAMTFAMYPGRPELSGEPAPTRVY